MKCVRDKDGALVPDLTDAATGGVLWEMAGRPTIPIADERIVLMEGPGEPVYRGTTLAEACARALLAEWGEG